MLRAYFDDAGTHKGAPVAVVGGLIGTAEQWEQLEKEWAKQLADALPEVGKPPLKMFHMAACEAADGEFASYKPAEQLLVAQHFRDIMKRADLVSTASAIDVTAWDELVKGPTREFLGPAPEKCLENCLQRVQDYVFDHPESKIAVMFDQGIENDRLQVIIDLYKQVADSRVEFCSITFGKVKDFIPCKRQT